MGKLWTLNLRLGITKSVFAIWALVLILFGLCRPFAVIWRIWAIIIDAVKSFARWPWSHISKEVSERQPAVTDYDASAAIVAIPFGFGVKTPIHQGGPGKVFGASPFAVLGVGLNDSLQKETSATCGSAAEAVSADVLGIATVAIAEPYAIRTFRHEWANDKPATTLASKINTLHQLILGVVFAPDCSNGRGPSYILVG